MLKALRGPGPQEGRGLHRLLVVGLVLLGHALLLGGLFGARDEASARTGPADAGRAPPQPVTARLLLPAVPQPAGLPDRAPLPPVSPSPAGAVQDSSEAPRPAPPAVAVPRAVVAVAEARALAPSETQAEVETTEPEPGPDAAAPALPVLLASAPAPGRAGSEAGDAVDAAGGPVRAAGAASPAGAAPEPLGPVPVYPTRLPPSFTLDYDLRRGPLSGSGALVWDAGPPYALRLEGRVPILGTVITQASQGGRDAHGLAPLRFTDRRLRRSEQAANFQRERGLVSFSGPSVTHPLLPGAQDRLSWMVQLAGIAEAEPARLAGGTVSMFVVGARGSADVWTFRFAGRETLTVGGQPLRTVQLLREPRRAHDTRVEVWLAPDAHHLPVRARLIDDKGEAFELMLRALPAHLRE